MRAAELAKERGARLLYAVACPFSTLLAGVLARRLCSSCGVDYNLMASRPAVEDACDVCGGKLVARDDDTPEALAARVRDYHEKTRPIVELFERKEFVARVDATDSIDEVQTEIRRQLDLPAAVGTARGQPGPHDH